MGNIRDSEDRGRGKDLFEMFKGLLLELGSNPGFSLAGKKVEGGDDVGEIRDEFPVEVHKSSERPNSFD